MLVGPLVAWEVARLTGIGDLLWWKGPFSWWWRAPRCLGASRSLVLTHIDHWSSSTFFDVASQEVPLEEEIQERPMSVLLQQGIELGCGSGGTEVHFPDRH